MNHTTDPDFLQAVGVLSLLLARRPELRDPLAEWLGTPSRVSTGTGVVSQAAVEEALEAEHERVTRELYPDNLGPTALAAPMPKRTAAEEEERKRIQELARQGPQAAPIQDDMVEVEGDVSRQRDPAAGSQNLVTLVPCDAPGCGARVPAMQQTEDGGHFCQKHFPTTGSHPE